MAHNSSNGPGADDELVKVYLTFIMPGELVGRSQMLVSMDEALRRVAASRPISLDEDRDALEEEIGLLEELLRSSDTGWPRWRALSGWFENEQ